MSGSIRDSLLGRLRLFGPQTIRELSEPFRLNEAYTQLVLDDLEVRGVVTTDGEAWQLSPKENGR